MGKISFQDIKEAVKHAYISACRQLPEAVLKKFEEALEREEKPLAKKVFQVLLDNQRIAQREGLPLCQDTGIPIVIVRFSRDYSLHRVEEAINEGIAEAVKEGYLRASVAHPITRKNTGTNTPAIIHYEWVEEGSALEIWLMPKGCGSENMSKLAMLPPSKGLSGIKEFVLRVVKEAGPNPCPPLIVGIGLGGSFERAAYLAKRALFREIGKQAPDPEVASLEKELLEEINRLGIGPLGFGGKTTALAVHIETAPCHIASLPVAVNLQCHSARVAKIKFL
uniref:Fumarate hydratase n=1 Tax=Caldimicrobium thiodismutans TaxID=1653476 RepID=A0A832GNG3_9BACT